MYKEVLNWSRIMEYDPDFDTDVPTTGFARVSPLGELESFWMGDVELHMIHVFHMENGEYLRDVIVPNKADILLIPDSMLFTDDDGISVFVRNRYEIIRYHQQEQIRAQRKKAMKFNLLAFTVCALIVGILLFLLYRGM